MAACPSLGKRLSIVLVVGSEVDPPFILSNNAVAVFGFLSSSYSVCEGSSIYVYLQLYTDGVLDQDVRVTVRTVDTGTATGMLFKELVYTIKSKK